MISGLANRSAAGMDTTRPSLRYLAEFFDASRTPRGLQENLYPKGFVLASGAGSPPHQEVKPRTRPPESWTSWMTRMASMWSIPGSSPSSFSRRTPFARARASHSRMAGLTYEAVTMCRPCSIASSATSGWNV